VHLDGLLDWHVRGICTSMSAQVNFSIAMNSWFAARVFCVSFRDDLSLAHFLSESANYSVLVVIWFVPAALASSFAVFSCWKVAMELDSSLWGWSSFASDDSFMLLTTPKIWPAGRNAEDLASQPFPSED
jgi:hypothetical protein